MVQGEKRAKKKGREERCDEGKEQEVKTVTHGVKQNSITH